ncbi:hypothetical protein BU26DRAFT_557445 [Trematosphaeria pertusa]|uniref:Uncharacterized protein n=1 Tax=Trematosphaeria pertusa TaxID=390896 RepID=A0A6A6IZT3_9PLEO|nr:uncharacterized protein BU26DRAFT_557445 [Trematosphaeria pertusa]KAF2255964.1 hypothetical protein BU26DRAFT_557445 [Trematosphaeria pertusa]
MGLFNPSKDQQYDPNAYRPSAPQPAYMQQQPQYGQQPQMAYSQQPAAYEHQGNPAYEYAAKKAMEKQEKKKKHKGRRPCTMPRLSTRKCFLPTDDDSHRRP